MRWLVVAIVCLGAPARADNDVVMAGAVGAGAQGETAYSAVELRLDATWPGIHVGLGIRGVWDDTTFRSADWSTPADLLTIVRDVEYVYQLDGGGHVAVVAGALAPAHVGRLADGYRTSIDDRWRTGVRGAASTRDVDVDLEIDDVLDPALIGASLRYAVAPPWNLHVAAAIDPGTDGTHVASAVELGGSRRFEIPTARVDVGGSLVVEPELGVSGVAFADAAIAQENLRWTLRGDVRAGSSADLFGPLYRIERLAHAGMPSLWDRARMGELDGVSAGASANLATGVSWLELGIRQRAGLGVLAVAGAGATLTRHVQAGLWAAIGAHDGAGVAELRCTWSKRWFSAVQAARIYELDLMDPLAVWSFTAWFGATSN